MFSCVSFPLCEMFPALSPFDVNKQRFHDVLILFEDLKQKRSSEGLKSANGGAKPPEGSFMLNGTLYRPAQNDDWY